VKTDISANVLDLALPLVSLQVWSVNMVAPHRSSSTPERVQGGGEGGRRRQSALGGVSRKIYKTRSQKHSGEEVEKGGEAPGLRNG
jgi:hypothetical protein